MHGRNIPEATIPETKQDIAAALFHFHVSSNYKQFFPEYDGKTIKFVRKNATKDALEALFKHVETIIDKIHSYQVPMGEAIDFGEPKTCHICEVDNNIFVRDHCHFTGKFRGYAHESCNLDYNLTKKMFINIISQFCSGVTVSEQNEQHHRQRSGVTCIYRWVMSISLGMNEYVRESYMLYEHVQ